MDVLLIADGVVTNVICADSVERAQEYYVNYLCMERPAGVGPGDLYNGSTFAEPPTPVEVKKPISKLTFLLRFTQAQRIAIRQARSSDEIIDDAMGMLDLADEVNTGDDTTIVLVQYLVNKNYLSADDAQRILS